jgi:hypothetical protein
MAQTTETPIVVAETFYKVTHERRTFCGIIKWWREVKAESLGSTLYIKTSEDVRTIIVNGKDYNRKIDL